MFSVIVPLFNKSAYIEKCLQSVINQTCQDFEVIVINDGSTDDGAEKVEKTILQLKKEKQERPNDEGTVVFKDITIDQQNENAAEKEVICQKCITGNIEIRLINQANLGVSTARNNGVKAAKSEYIAFLDADDWWAPTYLEEMRLLIKNFPEAGIYASSYYVFRNKLSMVAPIGVAVSFTQGIINYYRVYSKTLAMPLWTGATIIKKKVFESKNGFKPNLQLGEDFDLWIRVSLTHPVAFLNKPLAYYNQDVNLETRGVVDNKMYHPNSHYIFNLEHLEKEEQNNKELKGLLDKLRVYILYKYHLQSAFKNEYERELKKVNFGSLPFLDRVKFQIPLFILHFWQKIREKGSDLKSRLIS